MNKNRDVDKWLSGYDNPMKEVVEAMRLAILQADKRVEECIKWQAPTFVYKGNIASFFPKSKKHATLMFHKGAEIPGSYKYLTGDGKEARSLRIESVDDLKRKKAELQKLVVAWCDSRDQA